MAIARSTAPAGESQAVWRSEKLFFNQRDYFEKVLLEITHARHRIDLEMYIFEPSGLGQHILQALMLASQRGVSVRIVIDGIGSLNWPTELFRQLKRSGIAVRVYHPLGRTLEMLLTLRWQTALSRANRRDHRKMILIDDTCAFVGSMNIAPQHSEWRETGVRVEGDGLADLCHTFERTWVRASGSRRVGESLQRIRGWMRRQNGFDHGLVKTNHSRALRKTYNHERVDRIEAAHSRVWMTSAYFVPSPPLLLALLNAAEQGCDVRLLLPRKSDVAIVKWLGELYYQTLIQAGIQVYEYTPAMMHAKTLMVDDWVTIGSCNLNHRSLYHDLELDLVITGEATKQALAEQFQNDLRRSEKITAETLGSRPWIERVGGRLAWITKSWF